MIMYHVNSISIWVEATKNRSEGEMILARTGALLRMQACGIVPTRQVLDNKASGAYKQAIQESGMTYQLVPPDDHLSWKCRRRVVSPDPPKRHAIRRHADML